MTVHCPHCLTGYILPEHLLGAGGARVRCPGCEGVFVVFPEGEGSADAGRAGGTMIAEVTSDAASGVGVAGGPTGSEGPAELAPVAGSDEPAGTAAAAAQESMRDPAPGTEPAMVAGAVLDVLADFLGDALARSRARGTVLSDHGPAIIAVWDEYRRRAGADAPSTVFRAALRDRCGVDLSHVNGG
jgi:predicted Zn finger-like uncharacterized protein